MLGGLEEMNKLPYGYEPCRNGCGKLIQGNKGTRGRPRELCADCYKASKKEYLEWRKLKKKH